MARTKCSTVFVLKSLPYPPRHWDGYFNGNVYQFQKEYYADVDMSPYNAKKYLSARTAERACNALNEKVCNYRFEVEEVDRDEAYL